MNRYQKNIESLVYRSTPIEVIKEVREGQNYLEVKGWTAHGNSRVYKIYNDKVEEVRN